MNENTKQPMALRLADELEKEGCCDANLAAAELRRLHASETALLAALNALQANPNDPRAHGVALAAIRKAGGAA